MEKFRTIVAMAVITMLLAALSVHAAHTRHSEDASSRSVDGSALSADAPLHSEHASLRAADVARVEKRCGWISYPTMQNWFFTDNDKNWTIAALGDSQWDISAEHADTLINELAPENFPSGKRWWVAYDVGGGEYGYGCICMDVQVNKKGELVKILDRKPLPVLKCRKDPALKKSEPRDQ